MQDQQNDQQKEIQNGINEEEFIKNLSSLTHKQRRAILKKQGLTKKGDFNNWFKRVQLNNQIGYQIQEYNKDLNNQTISILENDLKNKQKEELIKKFGVEEGTKLFEEQSKRSKK